MSKVLVSTAYLAPVSYYATMLRFDEIRLEACEHYQPQSYRNRCKILSANGIMDLTIPVEKNCGGKTPICQARISNADNWQKIHWGAIESAYSNSPFFEYYKDDFLPFFTKKFTFLWDFNLALLKTTFELLQADFPKICLTTEYQTGGFDENLCDCREFFHPKRPHNLKQTFYYQVFNEKYGFQPDLSIIDLLFNMGEESVLILTQKN